MKQNHNPEADAIQQPEPVLFLDEAATDRRSSHGPEDDREREATELDDVSILSRRPTRVSNLESRDVAWYEPLNKFWRRQIRISVPHADCRDHLANERTYLGYLRSSLALSVIGVLIAQLYTIQHAPDTDPVFGYYVLGKPVATIVQASALLVALLGTSRFWRQQNAMVQGKVLVGGLEVQVIALWCFVLLIGLFAIHVGVSVRKGGT